MSRKSRNQVDVETLVDLLAAKSASTNTNEDGFVSIKNINILVMGVLAAVGTLIWTTVVDSPENFGVLQQQTAEIRTTVLEMRGIVADLSQKIDQNQRQTADQQARLTGLESTMTTSREVVSQLQDRVTELERNRGR